MILTLRLAVTLTATLIFGCSTTDGRGLTPPPAKIALQSWLNLQTAVLNAPTGLQRDISQIAATRLPNTGSPEAPNAVATSPRDTLVDLLTHANLPELMSDAAFEKLSMTITGNERPVSQAYPNALADFLTDDTFACREPAFNNYLQRRYPAGYSVNTCATEVPFSVLSAYDDTKTVWVDPKRVSSIHLLFASKSNNMASRFGHVALRLIVCPTAESTPEACDSNLPEHLALGFRAHIDELALDTLKALSGDYRAYLFANRFMDVYEEYAIGEFREIYSIPLKLDNIQREQIVRQLAEIHWRFSGPYSFFSRNCASLLQNALSILWPEFAENELLKISYLRPDSLFEAVRVSTLAEGEKVADLEKAERDGYFFSSTRQFYDAALSQVAAAMKSSQFNSIEGYLEINPVQRRQNWTNGSDFALRITKEQHLREAQILLEEYAAIRSLRMLMVEATKHLEQQNFLVNAEKDRQQLSPEQSRIFDECLLAPLRNLSNPIQRRDSIPAQADLSDNVQGKSYVCRSENGRRMLHEAIEKLGVVNSTQWQHLKGISSYWVESIANIKTLKQQGIPAQSAAQVGS